MAFYNTDDEDQNQTDPNQQSATSAPSTVISGQGATPAPNAPAQAPQGSKFVGIQQYLNANKVQSAKLANQVGDYVDKTGQEARDTINKQTGNFNQQVDNSTVNLDQGLIKQAAAAPQKLNDNQYQQFKKMQNAQYAGPSNLETSSYFSDINNALNKAKSASKNTADEQGQKTLVGDVQKNLTGKINQGANAFDTLLLRGNPTAQDRLQKSREGIADVENFATSAQKAANDKAAQAKAQTDASRAAIEKTFGKGGVQTQLEESLAKRAQEQIGLSRRESDAITKALKAGNPLNAQQLGYLGLDKATYEKYRTNPNLVKNISSYLTSSDPSTQISAQNVATPEEYARYAALNQLMGTNNSFLSDPTQAGKANLDSIGFKKDDADAYLQSLITSAQAAAKKKAAQTQLTTPTKKATQTVAPTVGTVNIDRNPAAPPMPQNSGFIFTGNWLPPSGIRVRSPDDEIYF